ncbi:MAG: UbiX family flavin prenyltransferase [Synergistaceae bacterium]|jgi:4-hydroxy-3-polyprenylbenzoate decarboxylase|nr:UbiX family flavin prenyltransferase [Synergistaceae bacterium]
MSKETKRLVIGMSGASGACIGISLLGILRNLTGWETHLVVSRGAVRTIETETDKTFDEVVSLVDRAHPIDDIGAAISSGTFRSSGMIIAPCSMKTLAGISCGYSENLLLRAADVTIKEGRPLVLVVRESPLSAIHLENMLKLARIGVIIMPAMLSYYNSLSVEDMTRHIAAKALDRFGIETPGFKRWEG